MSVHVGQIVTVHAEVLSRHGDGVGWWDDAGTRYEVHVPELVPGEVARVRVVHRARARRRLFGQVETYLTPSSGRRPPPCPHHPTCAGCPLMGVDLATQRAAKAATLQRVYGFEVAAVQGDDRAWGYRVSSKRVVGGAPGAIVLGSFRRGSHDLADMTGCLVDHPDIVRAADELAAAADALSIEPYDEASGRGDLRYVWLRTDGRGTVLVTLVTADVHSRAARLLPGRLAVPAGIAWALALGPGNNMRGVGLRPLWGRQHLDVPETGQAVGPMGFLQPNPPIAARAQRAVVGMPSGGVVRGALAFDLYAGSGATTRLLAAHFDRVEACEADPEHAAVLGVAPERAETFLSRARAEGRRPQLVVANPPRSGLGEAVCRHLLALAPPRIHLMSCDPRSLAADLERLAPGYRVLAVRAYDTLPQTPHVELVAWLVATRRRA